MRRGYKNTRQIHQQVVREMQVELEHKLRAPLQEKRSAELTRQLAFQVNGAELTTMLRCLAQPTPCKYSTVHSGRLDLDDTPEDHIFKMVAKTWDQFVENYAVRVFDEKQRLMRLLSTLKTYLPKAAKAGWDVPTMGKAQQCRASCVGLLQRGASTRFVAFGCVAASLDARGGAVGPRCV